MIDDKLQDLESLSEGRTADEARALNRQPRSARLSTIRRSVNALNSGLALDETGAKRIVDSRRERIQFQSYEDDHHFASAHQHSSTQESG